MGVVIGVRGGAELQKWKHRAKNFRANSIFDPENSHTEAVSVTYLCSSVVIDTIRFSTERGVVVFYDSICTRVFYACLVECYASGFDRFTHLL